MTTTLYGNPHSASTPSQHATSRIEDIRLRLLGFFQADPAEFDVVFVPNTTAGVKLVVEGLRSLPEGFLYAYHEACHTSLVGVRDEAQQSACLTNEDFDVLIRGHADCFGSQRGSTSATLISYPAQSHFDGRRYPLSWSRDLRGAGITSLPRIYTLLDAASLAATSGIDLSNAEMAPDFTVLSLHKIFGFPDLGALIVRRSAEHVFSHRKYFGGGTVDMVVCGKENWHATKSRFLHERLEDGTLPFHNIMALDVAMTVHRRLFGSMQQVSTHTKRLKNMLLHGLSDLQHGNGRNVCVIYSPDDRTLDHGPIVAFNIQNASGAWISLAEFDKLAIVQKIHVRTGSLCSPGGVASALNLESWEMRRNFTAGFRCGTDSEIMSGKPTGVIRASLGAMSTSSDVTQFLHFMSEFFVEHTPVVKDIPAVPTTEKEINGNLEVKSITVYPIKSCGGFSISPGSNWDVRPEGLAWDREWCLVHRGSGHALSQKRYPQMARLKPVIDLKQGTLRVNYLGNPPSEMSEKYIDIPLSVDPSLFEQSHHQLSSRVCGEEISPFVYSSDITNDFFSTALGVPCVLTRFPPGGRGLASRSSKARIQVHQGHRPKHLSPPGAFPDIPSPPESDFEQQQDGKILLANESPILMVHTASVDRLNEEIVARGGQAVDETAFRANIILKPAAGSQQMTPFSEDTWTTLRIGKHGFKLLGACRRCQMVCIDQATGEKKQEPFATLAKTRRFDGKVYFGCHMRHDTGGGERLSEETQSPSIRVGDFVVVDDHDT